MHTCGYVHIHMCEMNIKDICSCVHVYMQMSAYITLFAYVHVCVYMCEDVYVYACNIWMMLVSGCINACTYVFDHTCGNVCMCICMCRYVYMSVYFVTM